MSYEFNHIFLKFKNLSLATELLESCGWDEDEYEKLSSYISTALADITIPNHISSFDQIWVPVKNRLAGEINDDQIYILKKMLIQEWESIVNYYNQLEN